MDGESRGNPYKTRVEAITSWLQRNPLAAYGTEDMYVGKMIKVTFEVDAHALLEELSAELRSHGFGVNSIDSLAHDDKVSEEFNEKLNAMLLGYLAKVNVPNTEEVFEGQKVYPREISQLG